MRLTLITMALFLSRRGMLVGVLSGPGYCPREFLLQATQLDQAKQRFHSKKTIHVKEETGNNPFNLQYPKVRG